MITITSNISFVIGSMLSKFAEIENPEYVSRAVATALMPEIRERIHERGENSKGQQIGTYSNSYLRMRQGIYKNSELYKKGKNKGEIKNAGKYTDKTITLNKQTGVFTGEEKVGTNRINYNRTSDPKVIASLTRQLENSYVIAPQQKSYTIGVATPLSAEKIKWVEETYKDGGPIWQLTERERLAALEVASIEAQLILDKK